MSQCYFTYGASLKGVYTLVLICHMDKIAWFVQSMLLKYTLSMITY
jgi:hypothetical protein